MIKKYVWFVLSDWNFVLKENIMIFVNEYDSVNNPKGCS